MLKHSSLETNHRQEGQSKLVILETPWIKKDFICIDPLLQTPGTWPLVIIVFQFWVVSGYKSATASQRSFFTCGFLHESSAVDLNRCREDVGHRTFQSWAVMPKLADTHLIWAIYLWIGQVIYEFQEKWNFTFRCETPLRKWRFRFGFTDDKNCDYPDGHLYWQGEHPKIYLYVT